MEKLLSGKVAVVTGAGRGLGRAIALKLAAEGANLVVNYRSSEAETQKLIKEIEELGSKAVAVKADISKYDEAETIIKKALDEYGTVDILVNNAGITKDNLLLRMKEEDFDSVINVNLKGAFNCIKHTSRVMLKKKSGKIINISSVIGLIGNAGQVNYAAAKAGIIGMTKSVAKELASRGITVNAVAPGIIKSDMTDALTDKQRESIVAAVPLNKVGEAEDVANLVLFLASDLSSYITGQVINVDGGMVM
ncbi:3-oxoacyl-[acyl-carrier protein] reductase [Clostridium acetobutylicum]|uniref:3-oxoacyl-[acyl-carrier-protein] reductase n=1 Tax=Clostridium acetobutylicum (strain ATCC 824 / DSM 792 / JCM 1419 / IAM 19013 / LMG 5710 / NBRC 13948 / NRRL B-527 / VKM B-1787 / 2291 / W) TaxID=272562 RepID=Q97DA6_CLOAB|nr:MULTISPECIES: 3-oxoacyl-[acyl-carrier-protein] reductase [Clostridium]MCR6699597.1 3-oxoacyl-[acyl-carrier-protein] reductase [Escherichia coli]AAK81497.1 3-ketoacyl-acyl carrier protein reductase [Clostridium acetobutylicum ATCC 824]ADZ22618.1 3-ketoacyl-(acyl-carrier-protein) reductase [Clostridium acetobutylicum EA 2018]AEI34323.1 3-ketoacyl-(acyl-carrier-protein) reductase [Clostridium acetobutylicum DSM 1731]AWV80829.1 3-oxoacyl-[acyl-carrier-protein] reductase [Clostridium acetobutyli